MSKAAGIRVDDAQLRRALGKLEASVNNLEAEHVAVVRGLLPGVRLRTPVGVTGNLAASWEVGESAGDRAAVTSRLPYAGPVEYGVSGRTEPARMVADTIAAEEQELVKAYERELARAGERAGFGTT